MSRDLVEIRLLGGPMHGRTVSVPRGTDVYRVGKFFTYEFAGRVERDTFYAKRERKRAVRRMIRRFIELNGKHPRVGDVVPEPVRKERT